MASGNRMMIAAIAAAVAMIALVLILVLFFAISGTVGSGNVVSETRTVGTFDSIRLSSIGNVYITQDGNTSLRIEGEDNIISHFETRLEGNILFIETEALVNLQPTKPVNIYVSMTEVKSLSVIGSGSIIGKNQITSDKIILGISGSGNIDLDVDVTNLDTAISGSGNVKLKGQAALHEIVISASGSVEAFDLDTETCEIDISASGNSKVSVSDELIVSISGSGSVQYKGDPSVTQNISGSGSVTKVG